MAKVNEKPANEINETGITGSPSSQKTHSESTPQLVARQKRTLQEGRFQLQGYLHNLWDVTVERGTIIEDITHPDYWKHVAAKIRPHDELTVICEDGSWYAKLLVINSDRVWAKVFILSYHDLAASQTDMPQTQEEEYEVSWTSLNKFAITKKSNRGMPPLKDGFQTKLDAYQWLDGHLKTINS